MFVRFATILAHAWLQLSMCNVNTWVPYQLHVHVSLVFILCSFFIMCACESTWLRRTIENTSTMLELYLILSSVLSIRAQLSATPLEKSVTFSQPDSTVSPKITNSANTIQPSCKCSTCLPMFWCKLSGICVNPFRLAKNKFCCKIKL